MAAPATTMAACWWKNADEKLQTGFRSRPREGQDKIPPVATAPASLCRPRFVTTASSNTRPRPAPLPCACERGKAAPQNFLLCLSERKNTAESMEVSSVPAHPVHWDSPAHHAS